MVYVIGSTLSCNKETKFKSKHYGNEPPLSTGSYSYLVGQNSKNSDTVKVSVVGQGVLSREGVWYSKTEVY